MKKPGSGEFFVSSFVMLASETPAALPEEERQASPLQALGRWE